MEVVMCVEEEKSLYKQGHFDKQSNAYHLGLSTSHQIKQAKFMDICSVK